LHLSAHDAEGNLVLPEHALVGLEHEVDGPSRVQWPPLFGMTFAYEATAEAVIAFVKVFEMEL